jgi:hypothetical protein
MMKCPICNDETAGQETQQWGPEWAHVRCVKAYGLGKADAEQPQQKIADLERRLTLAIRQWDHWKAYALDLHDKLQKHEHGGSVMLLNFTDSQQC